MPALPVGWMLDARGFGWMLDARGFSVKFPGGLARRRAERAR
jgi:hypothetical protein